MNEESTNRYRVLVVDDDHQVLDLVTEVLRTAGFQSASAMNARQALANLRREQFHLLITDVRLPDSSGIDLLRIVRDKYPNLPAIVVTGYASIDGTKEALNLGAVDYIPKPFTPSQLLSAVERAIASSGGQGGSTAGKGLVSHSRKMQSVLDLVRQVADTGSTVLITGESGTGKELVARLLHRQSRRAAMPFVSVNSGGIPEGLLESELFGHIKGSYTGAHSTTIGRFQAAEGGTLFLDEVGNMSMAMQVKLLRTLQEREITPVGANNSVNIDVRLVAATNSDLEAGVRAGSFREDLYFRINVIDIHIPPLRERREDIIPLAEHFLAAHSAGRDIDFFLSPQTAALLTTYAWPGNVRELENAMERASVLSPGEILPSHLPSRLAAEFPGEISLPSEGGGLDEIVAAVERVYILNALRNCGGVRSRAARLLGIKRTTLLARMRRLGLEHELERAPE